MWKYQLSRMGDGMLKMRLGQLEASRIHFGKVEGGMHQIDTASRHAFDHSRKHLSAVFRAARYFLISRTQAGEETRGSFVKCYHLS